VTSPRCPACGASVAENAPWCTLCYADLRAPVAAPEPAAVAEPPAAVAAPAPAPAPQVAAAPSAVDLLDRPSEAAPTVAPRAAAGWPCPSCSATVPLEEDRCPSCLTAFLAGADPVAPVDLPLVGPIRPLSVSKSSRVWLMLGGTMVVCVVLTALLALVGLLL
jgi:hypothetical protein